jgi:hypothetical protein
MQKGTFLICGLMIFSSYSPSLAAGEQELKSCLSQCEKNCEGEKQPDKRNECRRECYGMCYGGGNEYSPF